jgi:NAD(P)H-binding
MTGTGKPGMILVTGATGTVGAELVPRLLAAGQAVRVLTRDPAKTAHLENEVEKATGDLDKPETLAAAMDSVQAVYLISQAGQADAAVAAARQAGVRHIVRQSTMEAGFDPPLGPRRWHRQAEQAIERSGLAWTHLRPTMMMTNTAAGWAPGIRATGTVRFPGGTGRLSPVDPRDIAVVPCASHPTTTLLPSLAEPVCQVPGQHGARARVPGTIRHRDDVPAGPPNPSPPVSASVNRKLRQSADNGRRA